MRESIENITIMTNKAE